MVPTAQPLQLRDHRLNAFFGKRNEAALSSTGAASVPLNNNANIGILFQNRGNFADNKGSGSGNNGLAALKRDALL